MSQDDNKNGGKIAIDGIKPDLPGQFLIVSKTKPDGHDGYLTPEICCLGPAGAAHQLGCSEDWGWKGPEP